MLQLILLVVVFVYLYASAFRDLYSTWLYRGDQSHGFLIPLISLYLIWFRRDNLRHLRRQPAHFAGIPVMIVAGMMLLVGVLGSLVTLQEFSIIVMIAGLVLCLLGKDYLWALKLPIAYLIFMIPIQDELAGPLYWPLQLLGANITGTFLEAWGIPVLVERQLIILPNITLEVIRGCSGVSSTIAILAIGIPLAFMTQKRIWCKVVLLLSVPVFGLVANWMRLVSMGLWGYYYGDISQEPFHSIQGLFFAQIGFVLLFITTWILSKVPATPPKGHRPKTSEILPEKGKVEHQSSRWNKSWLAALMTLLSFAGYLFFYDPKPVPPNLEFAEFPLTVGTWSGNESDPQKLAFRVKRADHELVRTYQSPSGREFQLYVAYFESQKQSQEIVNYWTSALHQNAAAVDILNGQHKSISVNYTENLPVYLEKKPLIPDGRSKQHFFFWYNVNGRILADRYKAKFMTILDAFLYGRSNGAFVLVSSTPADRESEEQIIKEERVLIQDLVPVLRRYFP
jgi:EpsI family protein